MRQLETIFDKLSGVKGNESGRVEARATEKEEEGETGWFVNDGNETSSTFRSVFLGFVAAFSLQLSSD